MAEGWLHALQYREPLYLGVFTAGRLGKCSSALQEPPLGRALLQKHKWGLPKNLERQSLQKLITEKRKEKKENKNQQTKKHTKKESKIASSGRGRVTALEEEQQEDFL